MPSTAEAKIKSLLKAGNCKLNGPNPWDPQMRDPSALERILRGGTLAAGETYMEGLWDCDQLDELSFRLAKLDSPVKHLGKLRVARAALPHILGNVQKLGRAAKNAEYHYSIGNELYEPMLGPTMAYSCAYWEKGAKTLDKAQLAKFDLICRKLQFSSGMRVLDIGCGWGGLLGYAIEHYGIKAVGVTPVAEQADYVRQHHPKVDIRQQDWREIKDKPFDRVFSVGMFEHVGPKNYRAHFSRIRQLLQPGGISLLHTIGAPRTRLLIDPWISKYIFPGGHIPSEAQIRRASKPDFVVADWHQMGPNYDPTLMAWNDNFQAAWPKLAKLKNPDGSPRYDDRFKRMWEYYLLTCAGSFRKGNGTNLLFQVILTDGKTAKSYKKQR